MLHLAPSTSRHTSSASSCRVAQQLTSCGAPMVSGSLSYSSSPTFVWKPSKGGPSKKPSVNSAVSVGHHCMPCIEGDEIGFCRFSEFSEDRHEGPAVLLSLAQGGSPLRWQPRGTRKALPVHSRACCSVFDGSTPPPGSSGRGDGTHRQGTVAATVRWRMLRTAPLPDGAATLPQRCRNTLDTSMSRL